MSTSQLPAALQRHPAALLRERVNAHLAETAATPPQDGLYSPEIRAHLARELSLCSRRAMKMATALVMPMGAGGLALPNPANGQLGGYVDEELGALSVFVAARHAVAVDPIIAQTLGPMLPTDYAVDMRPTTRVPSSMLEDHRRKLARLVATALIERSSNEEVVALMRRLESASRIVVGLAGHIAEESSNVNIRTLQAIVATDPMAMLQHYYARISMSAGVQQVLLAQHRLTAYNAARFTQRSHGRLLSGRDPINGFSTRPDVVLVDIRSPRIAVMSGGSLNYLLHHVKYPDAAVVSGVPHMTLRAVMAMPDQPGQPANLTVRRNASYAAFELNRLEPQSTLVATQAVDAQERVTTKLRQKLAKFRVRVHGDDLTVVAYRHLLDLISHAGDLYEQATRQLIADGVFPVQRSTSDGGVALVRLAVALAEDLGLDPAPLVVAVRGEGASRLINQVQKGSAIRVACLPAMTAFYDRPQVDPAQRLVPGLNLWVQGLASAGYARALSVAMACLMARSVHWQPSMSMYPATVGLCIAEEVMHAVDVRMDQLPGAIETYLQGRSSNDTKLIRVFGAQRSAVSVQGSSAGLPAVYDQSQALQPRRGQSLLLVHSSGDCLPVAYSRTGVRTFFTSPMDEQGWAALIVSLCSGTLASCGTMDALSHCRPDDIAFACLHTAFSAGYAGQFGTVPKFDERMSTVIRVAVKLSASSMSDDLLIAVASLLSGGQWFNTLRTALLETTSWSVSSQGPSAGAFYLMGTTDADVGAMQPTLRSHQRARAAVAAGVWATGHTTDGPRTPATEQLMMRFVAGLARMYITATPTRVYPTLELYVDGEFVAAWSDMTVVIAVVLHAFGSTTPMGAELVFLDQPQWPLPRGSEIVKLAAKLRESYSRWPSGPDLYEYCRIVGPICGAVSDTHSPAGTLTMSSRQEFLQYVYANPAVRGTIADWRMVVAASQRRGLWSHTWASTPADLGLVQKAGVIAFAWLMTGVADAANLLCGFGRAGTVDQLKGLPLAVMEDGALLELMARADIRAYALANQGLVTDSSEGSSVSQLSSHSSDEAAALGF